MCRFFFLNRDIIDVKREVGEGRREEKAPDPRLRSGPVRIYWISIR